MKLEESFVISRPRKHLLPALDEDATFTSLFPRTRIVSHQGSRRETSTPFTAMGQSRELRFVFELDPKGVLRFRKICDGNVWRSLQGEVRLESQGDDSTRVVLQMEGQTRSFVPEVTIRLPMRKQIDEMAQALRVRLEAV